MKTTLRWFGKDQRAAVATGILVLVTQVIMVGSLVRDLLALGAIG
ncbi:hypothetical protein [Sphingomonas jaspsi]|nr:hypothetical protein [Sphingomonas jaspsi]